MTVFEALALWVTEVRFRRPLVLCSVLTILGIFDHLPNGNNQPQVRAIRAWLIRPSNQIVNDHPSRRRTKETTINVSKFKVSMMSGEFERNSWFQSELNGWVRVCINWQKTTTLMQTMTNTKEWLELRLGYSTIDSLQTARRDTISGFSQSPQEQHWTEESLILPKYLIDSPLNTKHLPDRNLVKASARFVKPSSLNTAIASAATFSRT